MGLRINQNTAAANAYRNLNVSDGQMAKSLEKLSSGFRINRAADDAAGLSISEGMRSQIGGLKVAVRNAQDGISVVQTAEGALTEVHSLLQRVRDLSVQSANTGANDLASRTAASTEATAIFDEIDRISATTSFNGKNLLDTVANAFKFQVGSGTNAADVVTVTVGKTDSATLLGGAAALTTAKITAGDNTALTAIDTAIVSVSSQRSSLGAVQNRFEHTIANLNVTVENLSASESRIRDTDMAMEMTAYSRTQILTQAGTAMLAQANQSQQGVLQLLRG